MSAAPIALLGTGIWTALGRGSALHGQALRQPPTPHHERRAGTRPVPFRPLADCNETDSLTRASLSCAEQALSEAGIDTGARGDCALVLGSSCLDLPWHEDEALADTSLIFREPNYGRLAARLAKALELGGPAYTLNTACSSSANAMLQAQRLIGAGVAERVLVIGVEIENRISLHGFSSLMLLSAGDYRPFDADRDGLVLGEAVGAMVFGPAGSDGGSGFRLLGGAGRCDPSSPTNSEPDRIAELMREAMDRAAVPPDAIQAIKAHGTGTANNDRSEAEALRLADLAAPPMTSLKPYTGHTLGACGAVECALLLAAWSAGYLPATPGFGRIDPEIGLAPITEAVPLGEGPILANFFGFGGNNASLVWDRN